MRAPSLFLLIPFLFSLSTFSFLHILFITMFRSYSSALLGLLSLVHLAVSSPTPAIRARTGVNDFSCQSSSNPVVLFHGLGATYYEDINLLQDFLADKGLCTFSTTYGDYPGFPFVGGLKKISDSSKHLRDFVQEVIAKTGKDKVDLVGHSEGAFMVSFHSRFELFVLFVVVPLWGAARRNL